ncbi:MAG: hypothetical protein ABI639_04335 [Thermoanaerobaculia bacterium]
MSLSEGFSRPLLAYRDGRLAMDGVALADLVDQHGTPFFLVSERRLVENFRALEAGLSSAGSDVVLRYCAKSNNEAGVLRVLGREGAALLASHLAEVDLALACGFPPERIAYQRPAAPAAEIAAVLDRGVSFLHVFRPEEMVRLATIAERDGRAVQVSLRLRDDPPRRPVPRAPLASLNARLGLSLAEAVAVARDLRKWRKDRRGCDVRIVALNAYIGTQQRGATAFDGALRHTCELAHTLRREGLAEIEEINLGGGVPSPTMRRLGLRDLWARWRDRPLATETRRFATGARGARREFVPAGGDAPEHLAAFGRQLAERFRIAGTLAGLAKLPRLAAEPGRSIVGNAAIVVSRVVDAQGRWLFLDASRNFLGESPLLFSRAILPLRRDDRVPAERYFHLSGCTLNTTDVLDLRRRLPALHAGDALAFCDAGAYSISRATRYAGMAPPVFLQRADGSVHLIRRAEGVAELSGPMLPALAPSADDSRT